MARKAGVEWKAVGASLDTLAQTMRTMPARTPAALAYASSGVLQQAGVVFRARYITQDDYSEKRTGNMKTYTVPPGGTHGPVAMTNRDEQGNLTRNARGQFVYAARERKLFIKGKFVSRSGEMRAFADELASSAPSSALNNVMAFGSNPKRDTSGGDLDAGVDGNGRGYLQITGGYKAAEVGNRGGSPAGVKGWWRSLRSVQGRFATLLRKKYPDLFALPEVGR